MKKSSTGLALYELITESLSKRKSKYLSLVCLPLILSILFTVTAHPTPCFAEKMYFEGEGYLEPTPNSQVPLDPSLFPQPLSQTRGSLGEADGAGYTVTINPLADNFPNIVLFVTILDLSGNSVTGLTQGNFIVTEQSENESQPTEETINCFK